MRHFAFILEHFSHRYCEYVATSSRLFSLSLSLSPWERRHVLLAHQPYQSIPSPSSVIIRYCAVRIHALSRIAKVLEIHRFSRRMQRHRQLSHPFAVQGQPTIYLLFLFLPDFHIRRGREGANHHSFEQAGKFLPLFR